ncbi:MAG: hypothetical protein M1820_000074 [Bogoriella megaspora]|nr:MAG: hypothetical protein M1820_000074 [Bogoriella megaspora]
MPANASVKSALKSLEDDSSKVLGLNIGEELIKTGQFVPKAEVKSPPELSFAVPSKSATYIAIGIDLDAPTPSINFLAPILHWIQPGFKAAQDSDALTSSDAFVANYIAPSPPPISSSHRYLFILYEQPEGFNGKDFAPPDGKPLGNTSRMRFDLDAWIKKAGLGQPIAANYFKSN